MAIKVRTNLAAIRQINQLNSTNKSMGTSIQKISSGLRINEAADDAAGAGLSAPMASKNISLRQAMRNANDGVSLVLTAEGTLSEIDNTLTRMRELAIQSSNGTYSNQDRGVLNTEFVKMRNEVRRIASNANFNGIAILDNANQMTILIQAGIFGGSENQIKIDLTDISVSQGVLAISSLTVDSVSNALNSMGFIDEAINKVVSARASLGTIQKTLEAAIGEASTYSENLSASVSQIVDLDYASETANLTRLQIMHQAGTASFTQAKDLPQSVVNMLG